MVWIRPSGSTDSTTPMCSSQTMRSPACGTAPAAGMALPERSPQAHTSSTRPKPWPLSPSGTPASRAAQEVKYAHQGPTPEPAVAWRYWAIRGESLEPGGCSATPTSGRMALRIASPADPADAGGAVGAVGAVGVGAFSVAVAPALCSCEAKLVVVDGAVGGMGAGAAAAGVNRLWSCAMRARATSKLIRGS